VTDDEKEGNIASELGISRHTVNTYFQRLYSKLQVSSRPQLIVRVVTEYLTIASTRLQGSISVPASRMSHAYLTDEHPTCRNAKVGA
jgi:Bacterial regulatory proteins, luxR family